jgi:multidrug efflux pump subunit AcrA (membrane-fusion protein)
MKYIKLYGTLALVFTLLHCGNKQEIKPTEQDIEELVFASGQIEWDDAYNLTAQTDGVLQDLNIEVGMLLQAGDKLGSINNDINDMSAQTAANQLRIANENISSNAPALLQLEQSISFAQSKWKQEQEMAKRFERLYAAGATSKVEMENRQLAAENAQTSLTGLKKQYAVLQQQANLQKITADGQTRNSKVVQAYNTLTAPTKGIVLNTFKNKGDYVRRGEVIAAIADKDKVQVVLNIDENSIAKVKLGQMVFVKLNTEKGKTYKGKITEIETAFNTQTQSFVCKAQLDSIPPNLFFGTQLEANVLVAKKSKALLVPRLYVGFGNKVQVKGESEPRIIKPGIISTEFVEILEGLKSSDVLVPLKP